MKVRIDMSKCQAYGTCADAAPGLFTLDEWGYSQVTGDGKVPAGQEEAARAAAAACPALAVDLEE